MFGFLKKTDPNQLINGKFGETAAGSLQDLLNHFSSIPGWEDVGYDIYELTWMIGFFAHAALERSKGKINLDAANVNAVATGIAVKICQMTSDEKFDNDKLQWCLGQYAKRSSDYSYAINKIEFDKNPIKLAKMFFENAQSAEIKNFSGLEQHNAKFETMVEGVILKLARAT